MTINALSPLIITLSPYNVTKTVERCEQVLRAKNITLFCRINHSEAAHTNGLLMPEEVVLIFGNPHLGTDLMIANPAIGIELPLKLVIWQQQELAYLGYQDLHKQLANYQLPQRHHQLITKMQQFLKDLVNYVTAID